MRYFVQFSYRGNAFHGWQRQPNGLSVQEVMEDAFSKILQGAISLTAAGRTDAGVHATKMFAHFNTAVPLADTVRVIVRLNSLLPASIAVQDILAVREDAHARFDATARRYEYRVVTCKHPFYHGLATRVQPTLDFVAMNEAARILLETDDFASFCKVHTDVKTTLCKVTRAEWTPVGEQWIFTIEANRFLRNMVRAVVGTLFEVGKHRLTADDFRAIIAQRHRTAAGMSAPADGLFLVDVRYPESIFL